MLPWGCLGPATLGRRERGVGWRERGAAHELRSGQPAEAARRPSVRAVSRGGGRAAYHKSATARLGLGLGSGLGLGLGLGLG